MRISDSNITGRQKTKIRRHLKNVCMGYLKPWILGVLITANGLLITFNAYAEELRDIKPPVDLPETPWLMIALVVFVVVLLILAIRYWLRHKPKVAPKIAIKSPWEVAYERMEELRKKNLFGQGKAKEHFIELSAIAREYIENRFNIRAPEMTTQEFLDHVKNSPAIDLKHKELLENFLKLCDMVKFAKYPPNVQEATQSFDLVKKFVEETKDRV